MSLTLVKQIDPVVLLTRFDGRFSVTKTVNPCLFMFKDKNFKDVFNRYVSFSRVLNLRIKTPKGYALCKYQYMCVNNKLYGTRDFLKQFNVKPDFPGNVMVVQYMLVREDCIDACRRLEKNARPDNEPYVLYGTERPHEHLSLSLNLNSKYCSYYDWSGASMSKIWSAVQKDSDRSQRESL
ncbi:G22 [Olene mendosa nucleopolyhedrovirus]|uniref:G22 n=1 Tax=Olene mendosa nucleopolyhedrovirus TaxID=2933796 RepID=A0AAX3AV78_9ABAC|nr:G22 [Olene mendosa nucleopolyhedrovirus]UOQ18788.1 G22 [Olene mendosa nucleopolyhedrovirus]